jgi:UDPglucose 6-dehydrogenase
MRVSVIGSGYVGLVTAACLAEKGHTAICVDIDNEKVASINRAEAPIHESGLPELLARHIPQLLTATTDLEAAVLDSDITFIAVGTPFDGERIDLGAVTEASCRIGHALRRKASYHVVVVKSTVVPGTTGGVVRPALESGSGKRAGADFGVAMNPEFLTEGEAIADFMYPDRIVIGGIDERSISVLDELYSNFTGIEIIHTNLATAEMVKYTSNALLATAISFANEIANLCSTLGGIDAAEVMHGVHRSRYLSVQNGNGKRTEAPLSRFFESGCGFGGSCLPKDISALIAHGEQAGASMPVLRAVIGTNQQQPERMVSILKRHFASLDKLRVAVLGLAFKPDTSDIRQSPALPIIRRLLESGAVVKAFDPVANAEAQGLFDDRTVEFCEDLEQAMTGVDAVLLVTRWEQFRRIPEIVSRLHPPPLVVDGRRMLDKRTLPRYAGIGL